MKRFLLIVLSAAFLSACANLSDASKIYREHWAASYDHGELMFFNGGKDMRLVVHGVPGGGDRAGYVKALRDGMYGSHPGLPINFTEKPEGEGAAAPTYIVVQANAAIDVTARGLCQSDKPVRIRTDIPISPELLFAHCKRDRELSSLRLTLPPNAAPGSSGFDKAIGLATNRLLPLVDPYNKTEACHSLDC